MSFQKEEKEEIIRCSNLIDSKNFKLALEEIDKLIKKYPNEIELLNEKGIIFTNLGESEEAIRYFDYAIAINSKELVSGTTKA